MTMMEVSKAIAQRWKELPIADRLPFELLAQQDRER